jgi:predicted extracellular nuclease
MRSPRRRVVQVVIGFLLLTVATLGVGGPAHGQAVFINEIHYDNAGTDAGEAIEIAGPAGTDLTGWSLVLYNGSGGAPYNTRALAGVIPDQQNGFGTLVFSYPVNGIQNGAPDGVALVDGGGQVVQFLSYEGVFTAVGGPANGQASVAIGVSESGTTPVGFSLQLRGTGTSATDFIWGARAAATFGAANNGQTFQVSGPPPAVTIMQIQGAGHLSPLAGQRVSTTGVVTALAHNGFYLQDQVGDGDPATSDAIFVFTSAAPAVRVGDGLQVVGFVNEFVPGGTGTNNLSTTELLAPTIAVLSTGNPLPAPVVIGIAGLTPPTEIIDDDGFATFDPAQDGIDFYETLEAMLVEIRDAVVVAPRNQFGEIFVVAGGATGQNLRGGITIGPDDFNPERIQIDDALLPEGLPAVNVGDRLGSVVGVVSYGFGNFEVLAATAPTVTPGGLERETSPLVGDGHRLTVATFNVENLDPGDGPRINDLADTIVNRLRAPDILAVQEIQDNNGAANDAVVDAGETYAALILAIVSAGGPAYDFRDVPPVDDQDGGEPGGNIRVGYLFNPERVTFVDRGTPSSTTATEIVRDPTGVHVTPSPGRIDPTNPAFTNSRKPLVGEFLFPADRPRNRLFVINNHFTSKGGSAPLFGAMQPPFDGGSEQRQAQAEVVNGFVRALLEADPHAKVIVLGDLNDFWFSTPLEILRAGAAGPVLTNLHDTLPATERYTYVFEGNAQTLDHILVSANLASRVEYDIVHANAEFAERASDHDPPVARFTLQPGDLDRNGCVDKRDFLLLLAALRDRSQDVVAYDFSHDGRVDALDVMALAQLFSRRFGLPCQWWRD